MESPQHSGDQVVVETVAPFPGESAPMMAKVGLLANKNGAPLRLLSKVKNSQYRI